MDESPEYLFHIADLITKSLQEGLTDQERLELETWASSQEEHQLLIEEVTDSIIQQQVMRSMAKYDEESALERFLARRSPVMFPVKPAHRIHFLKTAWFRYAAILLLVAGTATFLYIRNQSPHKETGLKQQALLAAHILPGGNKAVLTLSDGSSIILDSAANGILTQQGGTRILKLNPGSLAYQAGTDHGEVMYNSVSTPKGGQFRIVLPDGSRIWLNAASSVKYPTAFNGKERQVTITGEAYFEITADKTKPFRVLANGTRVEVLGTSFNVNSYEEEDNIKTTLLQGSIKVGTVTQGLAKDSMILKPGQQALTKTIARNDQQTSTIKLSNNVDVEQVMAWKNGIFNFEGVRFEEVMRQVARWYDIEVVYEKEIPDIHFEGEISRNITLADLIKGLEMSGVHFSVEEGRRLVVLSAGN